MDRARIIDNPFDTNKASEFSDVEIMEQWVDYSSSGQGLLSIIKPTLKKPMLLLGGKGSGKTHLMRYCSAPVQSVRFNGDLAEAARKEGYLGIYILADGLNFDKFANKTENPEAWASIFRMYFETWLVTNLITTIQDLVSELSSDEERKLCAAISDLFDADVSSNFETVSEFIQYLIKFRKHIDFTVLNSSLNGNLESIQITFSPGQLAFGIPDLISKYFVSLQHPVFVYLIDEVENLTVDQQKFLNSLIRYQRGAATIKVGARLYGMKTYETQGSGEPIKRDSEYEGVQLDALLREDRKGFERFVSSLVAKRLKPLGINALPDSKAEISSFFEQLDKSNYYLSLNKAFTESRSNGYPLYLQKIKADLVEVSGFSDQECSTIVRKMEFPGHMYLEKASVFLYRKRWPSDYATAEKLADQIGNQARALHAGDRVAGKELASIISHFDSDILAQLYRDMRRKVPYAGFDTLIDLSQGIARNLLTNLKHIYRRSAFAGEAPFLYGKISIRSQSDGVRDGAAWFWDDAQPPSDGLNIRESVEYLATLFRTIRFSPVPSECDLCTFSVDFDALTENSKKALNVAENWSYLIRLRDDRPNKNSRKIDRKYQLGPMLAPKWEIAEHRRGSIELQHELANAIFDPDSQQNLPSLFKRRVAGMMSTSAAGARQTSPGLFDQ